MLPRTRPIRHPAKPTHTRPNIASKPSKPSLEPLNEWPDVLQVSTVEAIALALEALGEPPCFQEVVCALDISIRAERAQGGVPEGT